MTHADRTTTHQRGYRWLGHPQVSGSVVGMIGGTAFVWANGPALPASGWAAAAVAWAALLGYCVWAVFIAKRPEPRGSRPAGAALVTYLLSVAGMLVTIVLGTWALRAADRPELQVTAVIVAVGLHFLPMARAFAAPVFRHLGVTLASIGVLGLVLGWWVHAVFAPVAAVATGLAMLLLVGRAARARRS